MNTAQYNHLFSFIWNIANDVLVHAFEKGDYKKIIMPMTVLRRLDILLEPKRRGSGTQKGLGCCRHFQSGTSSISDHWLPFLQHITFYDEETEGRS